MANPVELYDGSSHALLFRFNPGPQNITFQLSKVGNSPLDIPTYIRPWMFDFTSQNRQININATLLSSTYNSLVKGTGSILDQLEDLMYVMSCNWFSSEPLYLFVPYPAPLNSAYPLATQYTAAGNTDYARDQESVKGYSSSVVFPPVTGQTRTGYDKLYYVWPQDMSVERDEASVNRVRVSLSFIEVDQVLKI